FQPLLSFFHSSDLAGAGRLWAIRVRSMVGEWAWANDAGAGGGGVSVRQYAGGGALSVGVRPADAEAGAHALRTDRFQLPIGARRHLHAGANAAAEQPGLVRGRHAYRRWKYGGIQARGGFGRGRVFPD